MTQRSAPPIPPTTAEKKPVWTRWWFVLACGLIAVLILGVLVNDEESSGDAGGAASTTVAGGEGSADLEATVPTIPVVLEEESNVLIMGNDGFATPWLSLDPGSYQYPAPASLGVDITYSIIKVPSSTQMIDVQKMDLSHPSEGQSELTVFVLDRLGEPIPDAAVAVEGGMTESTDASGRAKFQGLPSGAVQLMAESEGYLSLRTSGWSGSDEATVIELDRLDPSLMVTLQPSAPSVVGDFTLTLEDETASPVDVWVIAHPSVGFFDDPWGQLMVDIVPREPIESPVRLVMPAPEDLTRELVSQSGITEIAIVQHDPASERRRFVNGEISDDGSTVAVTLPDVLGDRITYYKGGFKQVVKTEGGGLDVSYEATPIVPPVSCREEHTFLSEKVDTAVRDSIEIIPVPKIGGIPIGWLTKLLGQGLSSDGHQPVTVVHSYIPPGWEGGLYLQYSEMTITSDFYVALDVLPEMEFAAPWELFDEVSQTPYDTWFRAIRSTRVVPSAHGSAFEAPFSRARQAECEEPSSAGPDGTSFGGTAVCELSYYRGPTPGETITLEMFSSVGYKAVFEGCRFVAPPPCPRFDGAEPTVHLTAAVTGHGLENVHALAGQPLLAGSGGDEHLLAFDAGDPLAFVDFLGGEMAALAAGDSTYLSPLLAGAGLSDASLDIAMVEGDSGTGVFVVTAGRESSAPYGYSSFESVSYEGPVTVEVAQDEVVGELEVHPTFAVAVAAERRTVTHPTGVEIELVLLASTSVRTLFVPADGHFAGEPGLCPSMGTATGIDDLGSQHEFGFVGELDPGAIAGRLRDFLGQTTVSIAE